MFKSMRYLVFLLSGAVLYSCDSTSMEQLIQELKQANQTYLVYKQGNSLYAVDPRSPQTPIPIEEAEPTLEGAVVTREYIFVANPSLVFETHNHLVYSKNGRLWRVDLHLDSGLPKRQLANETEAVSICSAGSWFSRNEAHYRYELVGEDGVCHSSVTTSVFGTSVVLNNPADNIAKRVSVNAGALTAPHPDPIVPSSNQWQSSAMIPFYDYPTLPYRLKGALIYDAASEILWWFDEEKFNLPGKQVATGVTSMRWYSRSSNYAYLKVNGELYRYVPGADTLGPSLATFGDKELVAHQSRGIYFFNGTQLLYMERRSNIGPVLVAQNPDFAHITRVMRTNEYEDGYALAYIPQADGYRLASIRLQDGKYTELLHIDGVQAGSYPSLYSDSAYLYYNDHRAGRSGYFSYDGAENEVFTYMRIERAVFGQGRPDGKPRISHVLLSQETASNQRSLHSFNTRTRQMAMLSGAIGFASYPSTPNNDRVLIHSGGEVYIAHLDQDNSLVQVSDNIGREPLRTNLSYYYNWGLTAATSESPLRAPLDDLSNNPLDMGSPMVFSQRFMSQ